MKSEYPDRVDKADKKAGRVVIQRVITLCRAFPITTTLLSRLVKIRSKLSKNTTFRIKKNLISKHCIKF